MPDPEPLTFIGLAGKAFHSLRWHAECYLRVKGKPDSQHGMLETGETETHQITMKTPDLHRPRRAYGKSAFTIALGLALGGLLAAPANVLHAQEETVSRAEYQALLQELEAIRGEMESIRGETERIDVQLEESTGLLNDAGRFAPLEPSEQVTTWDRVLTFTSPDDRFSLNVRGRIQPRYEYERREGRSNISSFSIRRVRLDFRGHAYTRDLTYRIMPELNRTATLRDAWANYRIDSALQFRVGQYNVPFAWERDSSSNRHQFIERSAANNEFEWGDGRDLGVMFHGNVTENLRYGIGAFGGEGRNVRRTTSDGHLFVARTSLALLGNYPDSEALVQPVEGTNLAVGFGAGYANKNAARDWHMWSDPDVNESADVFGATADIHFQAGRFSSHLIGFYRDVDTRDGAPSYDGIGYTAQAGFLIVPDLLFGNLRYSYSEPNTDESLGKTREMMAGMQIYQFGHGAKINVEAGRIQRHNGNDWIDTDVIRTQYQFLF